MLLISCSFWVFGHPQSLYINNKYTVFQKDELKNTPDCMDDILEQVPL